jgi:hypothetical protein
MIAALLLAAAIANTPHGIVVAHNGILEIPGRWRARGVANPQLVVASDTQAAVIDPLANEVVIADLRSGQTQRIATGETPIDALYLGNELYVLDRDARVVEHVGGAKIPVAVDPAFLRAVNGSLYVYSRTAGVLQEIRNDRITRSAHVPRFAADLQLDPRTAYLVYPRTATLTRVDLGTFHPSEENVGAVPMAVARANGTTLAVADPAAKRVWIVEGSESVSQAFARGFLRGLLGLGLGGARDSDFPTGVDRIAGNAAYDSATGTLYRFANGKAVALAHGIAPHAFAATPQGIVWWDGAALRLQK